jgi:hypothetical protein
MTHLIEAVIIIEGLLKVFDVDFLYLSHGGIEGRIGDCIG